MEEEMAKQLNSSSHTTPWEHLAANPRHESLKIESRH